MQFKLHSSRVNYIDIMQQVSWTSDTLLWLTEANLNSYILYNSIHMTFSKRWHYSPGEELSSCQVLGKGWGCLNCACVKTHKTIHQKGANFTRAKKTSSIFKTNIFKKWKYFILKEKWDLIFIFFRLAKINTVDNNLHQGKRMGNIDYWWETR